MNGRSVIPSPADGGRKLKVLYVQPGTQLFAGIERVIDSICDEIASAYPDEFEIDVLYTSLHRNAPTEPRSYNTVKRIADGRLSLLRIYRQLFRERSYDLVVVPQIEPTVLFWIASLGMRRRLATHLHGNPRLERGHLKARIMFLVMKLFVLRRLSYVFGTSPRQLDAFAGMFGTRTPRIWLPNPVQRFETADLPVTRSGIDVTFVNVGRFDYQKGQDLLVAAFAQVHAYRPDTRLKLVGFGSGEAALRQQIGRLGIEAAVSIEHHPSNPRNALIASDVFVASSRWEGWSLVICEALRFGLPVISTDCDFGPSDILTDRRLGRLVPNFDQTALVAAMVYYADNIAAERGFASFRKERIDVYSVDRVARIHADGLQQAASV